MSHSWGTKRRLRPLVPVIVIAHRDDGTHAATRVARNAGGESHGRLRRRRPGDHGTVPRWPRPDRGGGRGPGLARGRGRGHVGDPPEPRARPGAAGHPRDQRRGRAGGAHVRAGGVDTRRAAAGRTFVAHNASFDARFVSARYGWLGYEVPVSPESSVCTMQWGSLLLPGMPRTLAGACAHVGVE